MISPSIEKKGEEFGDASVSLSETYQKALMQAGALPFVMAAAVSRDSIAAYVSHCDGVLLTGGDDVEPAIYTNGKSLSGALRKTVQVTRDGGARDLREMILIDEVFRQRKPLLAICRGNQVLNVALGGTLIADIPSQLPHAINHRRMDKRSQVVHEVQLTEDSLLAKIAGTYSLGVNSTHHQSVEEVAGPLRVVASSADGVVEGMELKSDARHFLPFLLSVQFHPERLADRYPAHQAIFSAFAQACALNRRTNL